MRPYTRADADAAREDFDDEVAATITRAATPVADQPHPDERGEWPGFVEPRERRIHGVRLAPSDVRRRPSDG